VRHTRRLRRLAGYGWSIETPDGQVRAIRLDDGAVLPVLDRLVGTREAAQLVGVRPSNFVRDWAARPDFPRPVATLSSGRVWLAGDVERYAAGRRAQKPSEARIAEIARRAAWWQSPERTLVHPLELVGRVMASGSLDEVRDVERFFGRRALRDAISQASPGVFDRRSWRYWLLVLGLEATTPLPVRHVP
jgi:predicted DNA-binding transcriptional regulator AlpA